jgi:hypothetical protein
MEIETLKSLTTNSLSDLYVKYRAAIEHNEESQKQWKKETEAKYEAIQNELLNRMAESKKLETAHGSFTSQIKAQSSASSIEVFTQWLKAYPSRLDFATIKPRQAAIQELVEATGVAPDGIEYSQHRILRFTKSK